jgi:hypothetical protein
MTSASVVANWIDEQLSTSEGRDGEELVRSIAMDFLLGESYIPPWDQGRALRAFQFAITSYMPACRSHMAALVLPLTPSTSLETSLPVGELDLHEVEPPQIYLFDRRFFGSQPNDFQEFRTPITVPSLPVTHGQVHAYYTCFRDPLAVANGWEFSRAVWYQHFGS